MTGSTDARTRSGSPSSTPDAPAVSQPADRWEGAGVAEWRAAWAVPVLEIHRRIGSTNDRARDLAEAGAIAGTVVLADAQTAGRGRRGRRWHSPPGKALMFSIVLRPDPSDALAPGAAPLRVGLVTADAIERVTGLRVSLKWPNDLLVDGRKVGGILCEGALAVDGTGFVIAGIGVNVAQRAEDWPDEIRRRATSLELAARRPVVRAELAGAVVRALVTLGPRVADPLDARALAALADRDALRGRRVRVDGVPRGTAVGVEPDGSLRVRADDGALAAIRTGTVRVEP